MKTFSVENKQSNSPDFSRNEILSARINSVGVDELLQKATWVPQSGEGAGLTSWGPRPLLQASRNNPR